MPDYAIEIKVRNGLLLQAMRDAGYATAAALAKAAGVSNGTVGDYLALAETPINRHGEIKAAAFAICRTLGKSVEQLFPEQHLDAPLAKRRAELFCDIEELERLCREDHYAAQMIEDAEARVDAMFQVRRLLPRLRSDTQRKVIAMRYGIDGQPALTLEEVGKELRVSRERVRQIEAKALRVMRGKTE